MEKYKDTLLSGSIGRTVSIFYNDTENSVSFKKGKFLDFDLHSLKILEQGNVQPTLIPRNKFIRIEVDTRLSYGPPK